MLHFQFPYNIMALSIAIYIYITPPKAKISFPRKYYNEKVPVIVKVENTLHLIDLLYGNISKKLTRVATISSYLPYQIEN